MSIRCKLCNKTFKNSKEYSEHMKDHFKPINGKCSDCEKRKQERERLQKIKEK